MILTGVSWTRGLSVCCLQPITTTRAENLGKSRTIPFYALIFQQK